MVDKCRWNAKRHSTMVGKMDRLTARWEHHHLASGTQSHGTLCRGPDCERRKGERREQSKLLEQLDGHFFKAIANGEFEGD